MAESALLELLQIAVVFAFQLTPEDFHAVESPFAGKVKVLFETAEIVVAKLPERIAGQTNARRALLARRLRWRIGRRIGRQSDPRHRGRRRARKKLSPSGHGSSEENMDSSNG